MVAKGFMAAAAIIICCATTLRGNDQETKCSGGDCPTACNDNEQCSALKTACADGQCDDQEECCEKEQVSLEKCSTGKCAKEKCSTEKCNAEQCSTEKCSTGECAKSKCSAEKCAKETCSTETCSTDKCSAEKCTAGKCGGEKCAFTTTLGGLCGPLKCALEATPVSIGVTVETCSKSACSAESCATAQGAASMNANVVCNSGACEGESCPVAVCATQVCEALKCAVQSCTTASDDDSCQDKLCATGTCDTTQCATLQCSGQDCPAGQCSGAPCKVAGRSGQKCGVNARLTATGGEFTFTMAEWFPGTPVVEKCSTEVCTEGTCSTAKCGAEKCGTSTCASAKCSTDDCTEATCSTETCSTFACNSGKCAMPACASRTAAVAQSPVLEVAKTACDASTACSAAKVNVGCSKLETKLAELKRLQQEIAVLRSPASNSEMYVVDVKVVEVNRTKCRSLGFDFETTEIFEQKELTAELCEGLLQKNLAKVLFNPTLCVSSDRPATFAAGVEVPNENGDAEAISTFIGRKLEVVASSLGADKVRLEIAPTISEVSSSNEGGIETKVLKWDCALEAKLGKTVVMKGTCDQRVCVHAVVGRGTVEEVEDVQTILLVTVDRANNIDPRTDVRQATYEKTLVEAVKEPVFVAKVYPVPDLQVWKVRPQGVQFDADLLVAHLKSAVDPQSWRGAVCSSPADAKHANGAIQPFERNGSLVICQTEENHQQIANLLTKMRVDAQEKDAAREERELRDGDVTPASAEEPVEQEAKCSQGECSESKCNGSKCNDSKCQDAKCSKSEVSLESESTDECPGDCQGKCNGDCPETASCPCIGGTCTR